ncbi:putative aldehyde oxidase 2, partial [Cucurbita argyrosperma subsp. sororia]
MSKGMAVSERFVFKARMDPFDEEKMRNATMHGENGSSKVHLKTKTSRENTGGEKEFGQMGCAYKSGGVNLLTGETSVLRADNIYDCGQSLNPAVDLGQLEGAFVQGIGFFMSEKYLTNPDGLMINDRKWTYKIRTIDTISKQFNVEILNSRHHNKTCSLFKSFWRITIATSCISSLCNTGGN